MNWEQFRAILWLRWRLSRNQLTRGSGIGGVIAAIAVVALVIIAAALLTGATLLGALVLKKATANVLMLVWDGIVAGFLFFSFLGVMTELQRSESVDLTRLLHLPIGLKQVFVFNYLASLVSFGTILGLAIVTGLTAGLVIGQGARFLLLLPVAWAFVFMVTAWIYCLRGWLLSLMVNPRRRRSVIMWVTLTFILVSQSPQLLNLLWQRQNREQHAAEQAARQKSNGKEPPGAKPKESGGARTFAAALVIAGRAHNWVPLLWLPNGARGLAAGNFLPAIWGSVGMLGFGWWGLSRAYRSTIKFYRADEPAKPVKVEAALPGKRASNWIERQLPWLPEDTAAVALAQFRSMSRAPEIRTMLIMGLFMSILMPALLVMRTGPGMNLPEATRPFVATGTMVMVLFFLMQLVCNQFGFDRDAFRAFVLLPTSRARVLLGKNLAVLPLAGGIALLPLAATSILAKLSPLVILATILQFSAAFIAYCTIGNLSSILLPFRIASGSLKPSKQSWQVALGMMVLMMSFPFVVSPVFLPPAMGLMAAIGGWPPALVNFGAALGLAAAAVTIYAVTLPSLGRLLQRRETKILRAVTEVVE